MLRQSWCGLMQSTCHLCTGLLPDTWNWSPHLNLAIHANIYTDVVCAISHDLYLSCAYLHSICCCSVCESVCEILKFTIAATHKIDVVGKLYRLFVGLSPMEIDVWWSWSVTCLILSRNKLNRMSESKLPWWTPTVFLEKSSSWMFKRTLQHQTDKYISNIQKYTSNIDKYMF